MKAFWAISVFKQQQYNGFNIISYHSHQGGPDVGALLGLHANEIGPVIEGGELNLQHPLLLAISELMPSINISMVADPFQGVVPKGQRGLRTGELWVDTNRIADIKDPEEIQGCHNGHRDMLTPLIKKGHKLLATAGQLWGNLPVLSLHADQPHALSLSESLSEPGMKTPSYHYAYAAWRTRKYHDTDLQGLWNTHVSTLPASTIIAPKKYLLAPDQALGNSDIKLRNGLIKLPDPIPDGTFENQLVVEGIAPATICLELPLGPISLQQQILSNFLQRFLIPMVS